MRLLYWTTPPDEASVQSVSGHFASKQSGKISSICTPSFRFPKSALSKKCTFLEAQGDEERSDRSGGLTWDLPCEIWPGGGAGAAILFYLRGWRASRAKTNFPRNARFARCRRASRAPSPPCVGFRKLPPRRGKVHPLFADNPNYQTQTRTLSIFRKCEIGNKTHQHNENHKNAQYPLFLTCFSHSRSAPRGLFIHS